MFWTVFCIYNKCTVTAAGPVYNKKTFMNRSLFLLYFLLGKYKCIMTEHLESYKQKNTTLSIVLYKVVE